MRVTIEIEQGSMAAVLHGLKELPKKLGDRMMRKSLRRAIKPMLAEVKRMVPVGTRRYVRRGKVHEPGTLAKNIISTTRIRTGSFSAAVGIRGGWYKGDLFYGSFVHFGHRIGSRKLAGPSRVIRVDGRRRRVFPNDTRRWVAPQPFLSDAFEERHLECFGVLKSELREFFSQDAPVLFSRP